MMIDTNLHVIGLSGSGKTCAMKRPVRKSIVTRQGAIIIDGKGELSADAIKASALFRVDPSRVIYLDPRHSFVTGLNPLACGDGVHPSAPADYVTDFLLKQLHQDQESVVWTREWLPAVLTALSASGFTLIESFAFLFDQAFRKTVLSRLDDLPYLRAKWQDLFHPDNFKTFDRARILQPIKTRLDVFYRYPFLTALCGSKTTINFDRIFNGDQILIVNLSPHPNCPPEMLSFIGSMLLWSIVQAARKRPFSSKPVRVFLDEFQRFIDGPSVIEVMDEMRAYGLFFVLLHQRLDQLNTVKELHSAVLACQSRMVFRVLDQDAQVLVRETHRGMFWPAMQKAKDEIVTVTPWPVQRWENIRTKTITEIESESGSHADSSFYGEGEGSIEVKGQHRHPDNGDITALVSGLHESMSRMHNWGESDVYAWAKTRGISETIIPTLITEYVARYQVTGRTFPSPQEVSEEFIGELTTQEQRHYVLQRPGQPRQHRTTKLTPDIVVRPVDVERLLLTAHNTNARPVQEVIKEIIQRPGHYILNHQHNNGENIDSEPKLSQTKRNDKRKKATEI
jgi:hypothetical protein